MFWNIRRSTRFAKELKGLMITFENTKIAFNGKSNADLKRARFLFKIIGNAGMVKLGSILTTMSIKFHLPIKGVIKATIFKQFCGGETINDCVDTLKTLNKYNVGAILDYSVEGQEDKENFEISKNEIIQTIVKASTDNGIPFSVFKMTGLIRVELLEKINYKKELLPQEIEEKEEFEKRVDQICAEAQKLDVQIFIDAEDSWYQDAIDDLTERMIDKYNSKKAIVFNTIQLYRWDKLSYLKKQTAKAREKGLFYGVKLVRGAYMEKERERADLMGYKSPIQPNKEAADNDFNEALKFCIENLDVISVCSGSHNEKSAHYLCDLLKNHNISKDDKRVYFAQLLGMSDHITFNLSHEGYNVAKYVPYGPVKELLPYLIRRAEENTSVKGQIGRELSLISMEIDRRKKESHPISI